MDCDLVKGDKLVVRLLSLHIYPLAGVLHRCCFASFENPPSCQRRWELPFMEGWIP